MYNYKIFYCVFFILINFYLNKNNTGVVIYGVQANSISKEEKKGKEKFFNIYDKLNSTSSNLEYILKFNKHESSFNLIKTLESDLSKMATSYAKNIISSDYYFNKKTNSIYRVANMYDKYTLIKTKANTYKWEITSETKKIQNLLCYKALTIKTKVNNSKEKKFLIEAWFCPEIPISYGPKEFNGLPGLILELKDSNFTFYAKKINLNKKRESIKF